MVWKLKRHSKDTNLMQMSLSSADSRSMGTLIAKRRAKSCLRKCDGSLDNDWSTSGSSISSQRSETFKYDHSSLSTPVSQTSSNNEGGCSFKGRNSSMASKSRDVCVDVAPQGRRIPSPDAQSERTHTSRTLTSRSAGSGPSQKSKSVRFSVVEVRDYEREIADNPSCSSGPPVGIGWNYIDSSVVHLSYYESSRPFRKGQLEMVLTREERENILQQWGVPSHEIVSWTRALNKTKNQRRQTVRNLNKAQRVEEGIESATRMLKRVLSLKPSTKAEVKELQRRAALAAEIRSHESSSRDTSNEFDLDCERKSGYPVTPATHVTKISEEEVANGYDSPSNTLVRTVPTTSISEDGMDAISCISGYTFENSTTASAMEIERFHRELEMELFGDRELPSMVGQTLEVNVDIPEAEKVYHDPSPICGSQEPPSVVSTPSWNNYHFTTQNHETAGLHGHSIFGRQSDHRQQSPALQRGATIYGGYEVPSQNRFPIPCSVPWNMLQSRSEGPYPIDTTFSHSGSLPQASCRSSGPCTGSTNFQALMKLNQTMDGPLVSHVPLASHLSPNKWMEGDMQVAQRRHQLDAIIISEDDFDDMDALFVEQRPGH